MNIYLIVPSDEKEKKFLEEFKLIYKALYKEQTKSKKKTKISMGCLYRKLKHTLCNILKAVQH